MRFSSFLAFLSLCLFASSAFAQVAEEFNSDFVTVPRSTAEPLAGAQLAEAVQTIIRQTNELRTANSLAQVQSDPELTTAAEGFAKFMARTGKYRHTADDRRPSERARAEGYRYCIVLENIGYARDTSGFRAAELASQFFEGWKNSEGHRENMLNAFVTQTGVAIQYSEETRVYFAVQMFGRPKAAQLAFQIENRAGEALRYRLLVADGDRASREPAEQGQVSESDSSGNEFPLPSGLARTHLRCRPVRLQFTDDRLEQSIEVADDRQYVVVRDGDSLRLEGRAKQLERPTER